MNDDEEYLRGLGIPEDAWVLSGQQWYATSEAAKYLGVSADVIRAAADRGAIPGAILHEARVGWRLPRSGLIHYLADQRRKTLERRGQDAG